MLYTLWKYIYKTPVETTKIELVVPVRWFVKRWSPNDVEKEEMSCVVLAAKL